MARPSLEEIKAKADEYADVAKQIERAEKRRDAELGPVVAKHEAKIADIAAPHDRKIDKLLVRADSLKAEVLAFTRDKKKTYAAESELATFGVTVGMKQLERQPDKQKLWDLCKKKSVEFFELVNVMLAEADKRLGKKEVDSISERREKEVRDEYLKLK